MIALSLAPICSILDGTDDVCPTLTACPCGDTVCQGHSDGQMLDGSTDPIVCAYDGETYHRECHDRMHAGRTAC